jgi:hypothetical protein
MNLAHTHLTPNYISVKDYYIFRLFVIIPLLASLCLIANPCLFLQLPLAACLLCAIIEEAFEHCED